MKTWEDISVTNTVPSIIEKLHDISKLETAQVDMTKIMEAEKELKDIFPELNFDDIIQKALFQDKMLFELKWTIVAWIDLEKINTWDIVVNTDWSVSIKLPQAEILHVIIDENSKVFDRQLGYLTKWDVDMETKIRNQAKQEMSQEAIDYGILDAASKNAHKSLKKLLSDMNVELR